MKITITLAAVLATASALPSFDVHSNKGSFTRWKKPTADDYRGPCPMMNTLANHGFLPHNGKNLTRPIVVKAIGDGLNFAPALVNIMFDQALPANPTPNATYFDLDMLNRHNVLEHDASLSRSDAYFGNNHVFNQTIFDYSRSFWTDPIVTADQIGNSKIARQLQSKVANPNYRFTTTTEAFSVGEILAPTVAFGNISEATVNRTLVEYFFMNERLPTKLGWSRKTEVITLATITHLSEVFKNASSVDTVDVPTTGTVSTTKNRRASHFGI